ncbi:MAG: 16S rRNA (cytosine(1402)-N(4))-methyltransferase RsmH [Candidatus Magasanikbacteria bacterium]|nr:16S rRNA (cytosine(1402)-N(4))-methyltransferase RsmH [Candidatus Magasanikbacteria bacterium]
MAHLPVLLQEAVEALNLKTGDTAIDCTLGDGGHTEAILEKVGAAGKVLALDVDADNIKKAKIRFKNRRNLILEQGNFARLKEIIQKSGLEKARGILMDLGWSLTQLQGGRGLTFQKNEPLDMRLGKTGLTAAFILNTYPAEDIGRVLREYGEEKDWREITKKIVEFRKHRLFKTTFELTQAVAEAKKKRKGRLHPATKVFQALRVAVNGELDNLKKSLPEAGEALLKGGRLAVISFHSLEDRIVKRFFQNQAGKNLKIIFKKPITPGRDEISSNPRSRSAKLRVAEKI